LALCPRGRHYRRLGCDRTGLPLFGYVAAIINTDTTIVTFLMVFVIQNSQNRDSAAIQVKLDELIRVSRAQNLFVGIEHLIEEEIEDLRKTCESRAKKGATRMDGAR